MYCNFPVLQPLTCGRQSRCLAWIYKLPQWRPDIESSTFPSSCRIFAEKTFKLKMKKDRSLYNNSPWVRFSGTLFRKQIGRNRSKSEQIGVLRKSEQIGRKRGNWNKIGVTPSADSEVGAPRFTNSGTSKPMVWGTRGWHPGFPWFS